MSTLLAQLRTATTALLEDKDPATALEKRGISGDMAKVVTGSKGVTAARSLKGQSS